MGLNIPVEEIEEYQDNYLWDDIRDEIRYTIWEEGEEAWSDINISDDEEDQIIIDEILDNYEQRQEILDFSELMDILS